MSTLRRRGMMMQSKGGGEDYIKDGLVFWLDGIDKGSKEGKWSDLVGSFVFTPYNAISIEDGWVFNGVNSYMSALKSYYSEHPEYDYNNCTIEACFRNENQTTAFQIFTGGLQGTKTHGIGMCFASFSYYFDNSYVPSINVNQLNGEKTISAIFNQRADGNVLVNKYPYNLGASGSTSQLVRNFEIGRYGTYGRYFKGDICAIRVYNRILSVKEMLHNQQIDNIRFNLGL